MVTFTKVAAGGVHIGNTVYVPTTTRIAVASLTACGSRSWC